MFKRSKTSIRNIIIIPIGFLLILFLSKPSLSSEDALLLALNIECSGKKNDWSKSWSDNFFAISTPYTLQGSRYWIASGADEGDKKYEGDIGQNIFIGTKTKKDFRITGEGTWLKNKGDVFKFKFISKGNKSIIEHLSEGVEGTGGKGKNKRECKIKLLSQVDAFDGIRVEKYLSVRDKKIEKLLSEINEYKNIEDTEISNQETVLNSKNNNSVEDKDREIILLKNQIDNLKWELKQKDSNANQDVDVSKLQTNGEEIQNLTKKYEKEITLLKNQISRLNKETEINDNKIIELTNEIARNDSELNFKSKFEELSLQFESLNAELENITKINEQLDNEITSLKNDVDKKNIAEKEDKKIVQQKDEGTNGEENQEDEKENIEIVNNGIVKEVSFDTGIDYDNCGVANAKYIFYSDSKYELQWFCPENNEPVIYRGSWKNLSENTDLLNHISTIYNYNGVNYQDIVKINNNSIVISWNGEKEIKYKFTIEKQINEIANDLNNKNIEKKLNEDPNDLTGNAIDCEIYDSHRGNLEFFSVEFKNEKEAKYSQVQIQNNMNTNYYDEVLYLVKNEIVNYQVKEKLILIRNKRLKPEGWDHTEIWREDLWLGGVKGGHVQDLRGDSAGCQLIDINTYDPFKKYDEFEQPTEPEKKNNIL